MGMIGQFVHDVVNVKTRVFKILTQANSLNIKVTDIMTGALELNFEFVGDYDDEKFEFKVYARDPLGGDFLYVGDLKYDDFILGSWVFTTTLVESEAMMVRGYANITTIIHDILKLQLSNE